MPCFPHISFTSDAEPKALVDNVFMEFQCNMCVIWIVQDGRDLQWWFSLCTWPLQHWPKFQEWCNGIVQNHIGVKCSIRSLVALLYTPSSHVQNRKKKSLKHIANVIFFILKIEKSLAILESHVTIYSLGTYVTGGTTYSSIQCWIQH